MIKYLKLFISLFNLNILAVKKYIIKYYLLLFDRQIKVKKIIIITNLNLYLQYNYILILLQH